MTATMTPPAMRLELAPPAIADDTIPWDLDASTIAEQLAFCHITLETFFQADHTTTNAVHVRSPRHTHTYRVEMVCSLAQHDPTDPLPFHLVRERLELLARRYAGRYLNDFPPFRATEPTTEHFAVVLFCQLERMLEKLPLVVERVTLWESPTQAATCRRRTLQPSVVG